MALQLRTYVGGGQREGMSSRPGRTPAFMKRMGLYEKGLLHRAQKEEKIRLIRDQLMSDCTFTPNTTKSQSTRGTQYTTSSQSSHSPVWDRLYPAPSRAKEEVDALTNRHQRRRDSLGRANHYHINDNSTLVSSRSRTTLSTARTGSSMRLEQLYEHGRSKLRSRPLTDRAEAEWRRQRLENEQLRHCTFQPRITSNGQQRPNRSRMVVNLQTAAKDQSRTNQVPKRNKSHQADGETNSSLATPVHDVRRRTPDAARRPSRYPSEITVVTRPRTPSFAYSSPLVSANPNAPKPATGHRARDVTSPAVSPVVSPHPPSTLWRTPSPSPPRPPPLPPTRLRFKRENDDFMVDLGSFCDHPPPRLLFGESFDAAVHDPTPPPQRGGLMIHPRRTSPAPPTQSTPLPNAIPDSESRGSTISTEYGSI